MLSESPHSGAKERGVENPMGPDGGSRVDITEIEVRSALSVSRIPGVQYTINPYVGCEHGCRYCYACFMSRYSRHHKDAPWGSFVEAKVNLVDLLARELPRKRKRSTVFLSSVCDPYQPAEERYRLTRGCLELLAAHGWGIEILTRSPLAGRDVDVLRGAAVVSVGFSIPTDNERVRQVLEPNSPTIAQRVEALKEVRESGVSTWVFVAPMLPMDPLRLYAMIHPHVDSVLVDGLNYSFRVKEIFHRNGWGYALSGQYAHRTGRKLLDLFGEKARQVCA